VAMQFRVERKLICDLWSGSHHLKLSGNRAGCKSKLLFRGSQMLTATNKRRAVIFAETEV